MVGDAGKGLKALGRSSRPQGPPAALPPECPYGSERSALIATFKKRPRGFVDFGKKVKGLKAMSTPELIRLVEKMPAENPGALESMGVRGFSRKSRWTDAEFEEEAGPDE